MQQTWIDIANSQPELLRLLSTDELPGVAVVA